MHFISIPPSMAAKDKRTPLKWDAPRTIALVIAICLINIPGLGRCTDGWRQIPVAMRIKNNQEAVANLTESHELLIAAADEFMRASRTSNPQDTCSSSARLVNAIDHLSKLNRQYTECLIPEKTEKIRDQLNDSLRYLQMAKERVQQVLYDKGCAGGLQTKEKQTLPSHLNWITYGNYRTRALFIRRNSELRRGLRPRSSPQSASRKKRKPR